MQVLTRGRLAAALVLLGALLGCAAPEGQLAPEGQPAAATEPAGASGAQAATAEPASTPAPGAPGGRPAAAPAPALPTLPDDGWAARLVDHPALAQGDRDQAVHDWLDMLAAQPGHPLAEALLMLVEAVQHDVTDPPALRAHLASLDGGALEPLARGRLARLQGQARAAGAAAAATGAECFPEVLSAWQVLGTLGPVQDASALEIPATLLADPGFRREHQGTTDLERWRALPRSPLAERVDPTAALDPGPGWLVLAAAFDVEGGGPAFIEVDLEPAASDGASRPASVFAFGGDAFRGYVLGGEPLGFAGYSLGLAGGEQRRIDLADGGRSGRHREPVLLRDGRNVLLLRLPSGARRRPAVRILAADGSPHPRCVAGADDGPLGQPTDGVLPAPLPDVLATLEAHAEEDAHTAALAGLLLALDRRPARGVELLSQAVEREPTAGLCALAAAVIEHTAYLPTSWRRTRARELSEQGLGLDPTHLFLGVGQAARAQRLDKHEQAIDELLALNDVYPAQPWSRVQLASAYAALGMVVQARQALADAEFVAPRCSTVLEAVLSEARSSGSEQRVRELRARQLDAAGRSAQRLSGLASLLLDRGQAQAGLAALDEALLRAPSRSRRASRAGDLLALGRFDEAEQELLRMRAEHPRWVEMPLRLADLERLRGDRDAERRWLEQARALRPGMRPVRERLAEILAESQEPSPEQAWREAFALDGAEIMARYEDAGRTDSVVRLLDEALVQVFADGAMETLTHEIVALRDLAACDARGTLRLRGEVLRVVTIKPDGREFHPVAVGGEYVMPNLEPGDLIDTLVRRFDAPPPSGVVRLGGWFFRSTDEPFLVSRYVVRLPPGLDDLRLETHEFDGLHEVVPFEGDQVHVFEARDRERVLPEVGAPPGTWFLPWVEFGMDADPVADLHRQQLLWLPQTLPTHEVAAAAREAVDGVQGQEAAARALHAFVDRHLDQRGTYPGSAVSALLGKEGNPSLLYAALLAAAGIEHELVLSRGVAPAGDPEPDPPFVDAGRLARRLLVVVRPDDGEEAWCDLAPRGLPYGWTLGDAPGAEAVSLTTGRSLREPRQTPSGTSLTLTCRLAADGSAEVQGELALMGASGQFSRERLAEMPEAWHQGVVQSTAASLLPGIDLSDHALAGLEDGEQPSLRFAGRVERFLDADGGRAMPFSPLQLSAGLAGEGERSLPYLSGDQASERVKLVIELPEQGLELEELPPGLELAAHGWRYRLALERDGPGRLVITRELDLEPFHVEARDFGQLVAMAARVDSAERARLRFSRDGQPAGGAGGR